MNKNIIAITIGDINGIGIEILINLWKEGKNYNFVLFSNVSIIRNYLKKKKINCKINIVNNSENNSFKKNYLNIYSYSSKNNINNSILSLKYAYIECKNKNYIGIITLPLRKDLVNKESKDFIGHTEFFEKLDKKKFTNMIMYKKNLIITPLTTHISIKSIPRVISKKNYIYERLFGLCKSLVIDFNIAKPKIMVSGLNPHAGDNGTIGFEEKLINKEIKKIRKIGIDVKGPESADSMLLNNNINKYDCFVFLYHDQGLIPFKFISQYSGVNFTGNLDIIRVSPDHGTAYDRVGKGKFKSKSLINCFNLVKKIRKNRIFYAKSKKISKSKLSY